MKIMLPMLLVSASLVGCVEREMTITSSPSGALVIISDKEIGRTPLTHSFTWYGDYDVILRMEGYETLKTHAHLTPPAYEIPPFDLFSAIVPWTYHDRRYLHFQLEKLVLPTEKVLIKNADEMRIRTQEHVDR